MQELVEALRDTLGKKLLRKCKHCGELFLTYVDTARWCSNACAGVEKGRATAGKKRTPRSATHRQALAESWNRSPTRRSIARESFTQENNPAWNGGRSYNGKYVTVKTDQRSRSGHTVYQLEHRAVAERVLGRKLESNETVHHINMNPVDNRNENLLICDRQYHSWLHHEYARRFAAEKFGTGRT